MPYVCILHDVIVKKNMIFTCFNLAIFALSCQVAPIPTKETLSTGRALVARAIDPWMTFEEYDKYTK